VVKTKSRKNNFNTLCKAKTCVKRKLTPCEELQSANDTLQSYPKQRLKKDPSNFPDKRLQVHKKMAGIFFKLKNP
jgi:hypothetical protein